MKARAEVGREEGPLLTPDLSYYWEGAREWCGDNKWDEEKNVAKKGILLLLPVNNMSVSRKNARHYQQSSW